MNTNQTGFKTTEQTEMNSTKSQAFTEANEDNKDGRSFSDSFVTFVIFCSQPFRVFGVFRGSSSGSVSFVSLWFKPFRVFGVFRGSQKFVFSAFLCGNLCALCVKIPVL